MWKTIYVAIHHPNAKKTKNKNTNIIAINDNLQNGDGSS